MNQVEKIILGIDPGTNVMGYGVIRVTGNKAQLVVMGVIDMRKESDPYLRLGKIFERVTGIIDEYLPDEMAIEAPFFGKNVQSMLKLGRAQGVAIAAAIHHDVPIHEYAPLKSRWPLRDRDRLPRNRWRACCKGCCTSVTRICRNSWMLRMPWVQLIVIFCKWASQKPMPGIIAAGRIMLRKSSKGCRQRPCDRTESPVDGCPQSYNT